MHGLVDQGLAGRGLLLAFPFDDDMGRGVGGTDQVDRTLLAGVLLMLLLLTR